MKILFVLEHFYPYKGGVEFLFMSLSKELIAQGHEVKVVTTLFDSSLQSKEVVNGIEVHRVRCGNRFLFSILALPKTRKLAKWSDVIHTSSYNAAMPAWMATLGMDKRLIITFHEYWGRLWNELPYLKWYERLLFRTYEYVIARLSYTNIVAVSNATAHSLQSAGVDKHKLITIYNGIDYQELRDTLQVKRQYELPKAPYFVFVGRLGVSKGLDILIPAIDIHLSNSDKKAVLVLPKYPVGLFKRIKVLLDKMENRSKLILLHDLDRAHLYRLVSRAAYSVVPSYSEGFGYVALEAQLLGTPVVSSHKGSLPEVVLDKHIAMDEFNVDELVKALMKADKEEWTKVKYPQFKIEECVAEYMQLYVTTPT